MNDKSVHHHVNSLCAQAKPSTYYIDCSTNIDDSISKSHKSKGQSTEREIKDLQKNS